MLPVLNLTAFRFAAVRAALVAFTALAAAPAMAQILPASARSLALAGNDTAVARAFGAISVNPAGLAMPGSEFSLTVAPVRASVGTGPVSLADWKNHEGKVVSHATKTKWMDGIDSADGQHISAGAGTAGVALTFWNVGLQHSTILSISGSLPPDVMEALLFGNAGRTCPRERTGCEPRPQSLSFAQGSVDASVTSTVALSAAFPLAEWMEDVEMIQAFDQLSLGVTVTYTQGHAVAVAESSGSIPFDRPRAEFGGSIIHTPVITEGDAFSHYLNNGSGLGLDLGVMFALDSLPELTLGAAVQNVFNTFSWDTSKLVSQNAAGSIDNGKVNLDLDLGGGGDPYDAAAPAVKERIEDLTFKPTVRIGAAYDIL
ncbi:MAG: conjugal transfer protein TraF, partial [Spirochaetaceae bacterium]|nr:conjugal transfer protein TraF [Spirochaetaceae bacterium]